MNKKILKFVLKMSVSLVFLVWIILKVDWQGVGDLLKEIKFVYIGIYLIFLIVGMAISAYKWKLLAQAKGMELPFSRSFRLYLTGTFINNFMPSFIGGDAYRIYQAGKESKKYSQSAAAVVMDRLTGFFGAMILVVFFSTINFPTMLNHKILLFLNGIITLVFLAVLIFMMTRRAGAWEKIWFFLRDKKILPIKLLNFSQELLHYSDDMEIIRKSLLWSVIFGIVGIALTNYVLFEALGAKVAVLDYLSVIFMISFVSSLPISINNIGVKEWAYVTFFGFFGVPSTIVVTVAILSRFLQMILSFFAWPIYLQDKK